MDYDLPDYPYDLEELKHIEKLLSKIPLYENKIEELSRKIKHLSRQASEAGSFSDVNEIDKLIHKAFYIELENRPFNSNESRQLSRLVAEIKWHGTIKNRNVPCEICGENRSIDKCHIIPTKLGGPKEADNLLFFCPTHHRLFDRFMLSKAEWALIDWDRKSIPSQEYALSVILEAHKKFWAKDQGEAFENIGQFAVNEVPFIKYVIEEIGKLFVPGRTIKRNSIYRLLDKNIKEISKKIIADLVKNGVLVQIKENSQNLLLLASNEFKVSEELVNRIWQEI